MSHKNEETKKAVPSLQLVKGGIHKGENPDDIPQPSLFVKRLIHHPDQKIATQMIQKQAELEADQIFGSELTECRMHKDDLEARYKASKAILTELEARKVATYQYIKTGIKE